MLLLSDVAAARSKPVPAKSQASPLDYPFNFILTSATIPAVLAAHLDAHHPHTTRLVSLRLHRLPAGVLEFAPYTSGNRNADIPSLPHTTTISFELPLGVLANSLSCWLYLHTT
jgi:ATP-dependent RNA helicase MRH4